MQSTDSSIQIETPAEGKPQRTDRQIWGIYITLCIISVVELYSASSFEVTSANVLAPVMRHVMFLLFGLGFMIVLQNTHYKFFYRLAWPFFIISVLAMVYTIFCGTTMNGATRCFTILGFTVQPAEMIKLSVALIIAAILCKEQMKGVNDVTMRGVKRVTACLLLCCALLFSEGLTNTILLSCIGLSMILIGGVRGKKFWMVVLALILFAAVGVCAKLAIGAIKEHSKQDEQKELVISDVGITVGTSDRSDAIGSGRMSTWVSRIQRFLHFNKHLDPITNENRQEQYSFIAQAHGGLFGVLPGHSRETARLPLAYSDYIYAIIIEETGLAGGIVVLILYIWLLARAGRVAYQCQTAFPAFLVIGMAVFITWQALCHMAIVTGLMPVSGQPLPLISKGGTSILITSVALGIMLSVSRFAARKGDKAEIRQELSSLPDEVRAANPS